jgi:hypothetical protein
MSNEKTEIVFAVAISALIWLAVIFYFRRTHKNERNRNS